MSGVAPRFRGVRRTAALHGGAAIDALGEWRFRAQDRAPGLLHADSRAVPDRVEKALSHGVRYLERQQDGDGMLRGFLLLPGASTTWITAHAAFVVEGVPQLRWFCARAAAGLRRVGATDGGWGYNRRVAVDCDSSAQALMVIARFQLPIEPFLLANLAAAQHRCGGYPTYASSPESGDAAVNGWQSPHSDVSALVAEALHRTGGFEDRVAKCRRWLEDQKERGVLPGYWWGDDCYALWVQSRTGMLGSDAEGVVERELAGHRETPQAAMLLSAAVAAGLDSGPLQRAASIVLSQQLADGSWPCAPCLRVTDSAEHRGGLYARGRLYPDRRRVFSTAHAVAALFQVKARLTTADTPCR